MFWNSSILDWNLLATLHFNLYVLIPWSYWNKTLTILDNIDTIDYFTARPRVLRRPRHLKVYRRLEQKEKCLPIPVVIYIVCNFNVHPLLQLHALNITDTDQLSLKWLWPAFHYDSSPSWYNWTPCHTVWPATRKIWGKHAPLPSSLPYPSIMYEARWAPELVWMLCIRDTTPRTEPQFLGQSAKTTGAILTTLSQPAPKGTWIIKHEDWKGITHILASKNTTKKCMLWRSWRQIQHIHV